MQAAIELEYIGLFTVADRRLRQAELGAGLSGSSAGVSRALRRGEHLLRSGDEVHHLYRVVSGVLKSYFIHQDGDEQIIGFHLPGDLIGCDALANNRAAFSVVALDTACVAREPGDIGAIDTPFNGAMDRQLYTSLRQEIFRLARLLHMERGGTDARLARFLLDFAEAQGSRGYDRREFHLPMGRKDLARYIGLVPETVSRIFSRLRDRGILRVENNHICILDYAALSAIATSAR